MFCILRNKEFATISPLSLIDIIDKNVDSLRFYYLGNKYQTKVEHVGIERGIAIDQPLIL